MSAPNFAKTKRGANGKFLPKPLLFHLRLPHSKTNEPKFCKILSPNNSFCKTSSALFRHLPENLRAEHQKNVLSFFKRNFIPAKPRKQGTFFFGVLPSKYSGKWWNNADEVLAKLFFGERICQNFGSFVFEFGSRKWKRRGLGRNFPFAPLVCFFGFAPQEKKSI